VFFTTFLHGDAHLVHGAGDFFNCGRGLDADLGRLISGASNLSEPAETGGGRRVCERVPGALMSLPGQRPGLFALKKSQHHARDEHQRAERREEHASSGSSVAETSPPSTNGHFHSARRRYR